MSKVIAVTLMGLLIGVGGYFVFFYESCKEPSKFVVRTVQFGCIMETFVKIEDVYVDACREFGKEDNCKFIEEDRDMISIYIDKVINMCIKNELKIRNFCTDKIQELLDESNHE